MLWSIFEIVNQYLKYNWHSHFSYLVGINIQAYFGNQSFDVFLKLLLFYNLRLCQILTLQINPIVIERSSSLVFIRKLRAILFRYKTNEVLLRYFDSATQLSTVLSSRVIFVEIFAFMCKIEKVYSFEKECRLDQYKALHAFYDCKRQHQKNILEFLEVIGGLCKMIEVYKCISLLSPTWRKKYSGLKFIIKLRVNFVVCQPGGGCRNPYKKQIDLLSATIIFSRNGGLII